MHCYVINLPSASARLDRTRRELAAYAPSVNWSVPEMSVASCWSDSDFAKVYNSQSARKIYKRDLSRGEVACALSHQSALKEFLRTKDSSCLIVEDDVLFSPAVDDFFKAMSDDALLNGPKPICVVLSEASAVRYWRTGRRVGGIKLIPPVEMVGALAYIVNRAGADCILAANPCPISVQSDHWTYYRKRGLHLLVTEKILAGSYDFDRADSSLTAGRQEVYEARRAFAARPSLVSRKWRAARWYLRKFWWMLTGVNQDGVNRSNVRIFRFEEHGGHI